MGFVRMISPEQATGIVQQRYNESVRRTGRISEVVKAVSLRPEALRLSDDFRRVTLFGASSLGRRREEMIATLISDLLQCTY